MPLNDTVLQQDYGRRRRSQGARAGTFAAPLPIRLRQPFQRLPQSAV